MSWNANELDPEWPFDLVATRFVLKADSTALLVIDMQVKDMRYEADSAMAKQYPAVVRYWNQRIDETVIPNIRLLIDSFRARKCRIVYTRNGNTTTTGDQVTSRLRRKRSGPVTYHRGSPRYDIDPRLAPTGEDLIIDKLTSGAFTASPLDHALRNMGVQALVIAGVLTDMCVFGTARCAAELGYDTLICEDACATLTPRAHTEALLMHARVFGRVATTADVLDEL